MERCRTHFEKLSVLMPLYNERWTLSTIIDRVLAVPLPLELELVCVDDGSSDGSWEELQTRPPRIRGSAPSGTSGTAAKAPLSARPSST